MLNGFFFNTPVDHIYLGHQIAEIYKERVYAPFLVDRHDLTILDVGANIGMTSYYFSQFAKIVHALEPAKEHQEVFRFMSDFNKLTNVVLHPLALSNEDSQATLFHMSNKTMFSLKPAAIEPGQDQEKVDTIRLDTFLKSRKIEHVDFMKLDVEGAEPEITCGEGFQKAADRIDILFLELHSWNGRNPNQIREGLKQAGFTTFETIPNDASLLVARK